MSRLSAVIILYKLWCDGLVDNCLYLGCKFHEDKCRAFCFVALVNATLFLSLLTVSSAQQKTFVQKTFVELFHEFNGCVPFKVEIIIIAATQGGSSA